MNLPNKLTLFRIILVPLIIITEYLNLFKNIYLFNFLPLNNFIILIIFTVAIITDFLDGFIARRYQMITDFGKFMDPLADKILVFSCLIILLRHENLLSGWMVIVMLIREFAVTGLRLIASSKNKVIPAGILGKIKTNLQNILIIVLFIFEGLSGLFFNIITNAIIYITIIITIISGIVYIIKNKEFIAQTK